MQTSFLKKKCNFEIDFAKEEILILILIRSDFHYKCNRSKVDFCRRKF